MYDRDDCCIVKFASYGNVVKSFGSTQEELLSGINSLYASGGTNTDNGLSCGLQEILKKQSSNEPIIIMICDGDVYYNQSTIDIAKENGIKIYTVNISYAPSHSYLQKIADETGGQYYYATTASELTDILMSIQCQTISGIDTTDTDGDGLYDVFESKGLRVSNGNIIYSDPLKKDTDGDGLLDSEEIIYSGQFKECEYSQYEMSSSGQIVEASEKGTYGKYVTMVSYPDNVDSDGDSYCDGYVECKTITAEATRYLSANLRNKRQDIQPLKVDIIMGLDNLCNYARDYLKGKTKNGFADRRKLVFDYIRYYAEYTGFKWAMTSGKINTGFITYVNTRNDTLKEYFNTNWTFTDPVSKEQIDGGHMMATLSGMTSSAPLSYADTVINQFDIWNLSGWAGDLQSFMVRRIRADKDDRNSEVLMYLPGMTNHLEVQDAVEKYLGHPNSCFSMSDMYADVDAVSLYDIIQYHDVDTAVLQYYESNKSDGCSKRYANFVDGLLKHENRTSYSDWGDKKLEFKKVVYKYLYKIAGIKEWPIVNENKAKDARITDTIRLGTKNGFVEFIWSKQ